MHIKLLCLLLLIPFFALSQFSVSGKVVDQKTNLPLPFATIIVNKNTYIQASSDGEFSLEITTLPSQIVVSYIGYKEKRFTITTKDIEKILINLTPKEETLLPVVLENDGNLARNLIRDAILHKKQNDPQKKLEEYSYKSYQKLFITSDNKTKFVYPDTSKVAIEKIFNEAHSFLSEKISLHQFQKSKNEKETILATRMTGFRTPVYDVAGIQIQSHSLYQDTFTIFDTEYAGPLSKSGYKNYYYKVLDTTKTKFPAYIVLFQPKKSQKVTKLQGILYLDIHSFAVQKAILELRGELNLTASQEFRFLANENLWIPHIQKTTIKPGLGKQKISLFGGQISVGRLATNQKNSTGNNDILQVTTNFFDFKTSLETPIKQKQPAIEIKPDAKTQPETFWNQYRTTEMTVKDQKSFPIIDSIVKAQKIERRIDIIKNFNRGYYPLGIFNFDLTYPLKYNNYEGIRMGIGGITNEKLSEKYRFEGYVVYGFRDDRFKFGLGGGLRLDKNSGSWWNINYKDDLKELGSFFYLTDRRVYSLFEPRLVNITAFYSHRTWSSSIQYRLLPQLLSEVQISFSDIDQISRYRFLNNGQFFSSYQMAESTIAFRWTPFSKFLKSPDGFNEIKDGYPKITTQYVQGYQGIEGSDFDYSKFGLKTEYIINRLNQSRTAFLLEGNIAFGDIPITHLFHAYPNAPTKEVILQRFSVAGRRSFETMYFNEFYSDRLATLQVRHTLRPFKLSERTKPELVLITRYAIGDIRNPESHQNINLNSLKELYQESGFEINKLFAGFGLSFAYRYGAYYLPNFEDNIAFKFTFYLKL